MARLHPRVRGPGRTGIAPRGTLIVDEGRGITRRWTGPKAKREVKPMTVGRIIEVTQQDLEYIATFQCDRISDGSGIACDKAEPKHQPLCNSCWARSWATQQLKKEKEITT